MFKQSQKLILTATVFAMTIASSASYADEDDRRGRDDRDDGEYVAITLKTDPNHDPEAACVALQLGTNLLSSVVPDSPTTYVSVEPADKVVLFPTLAGVELVNPDTKLDKIMCKVPGEDELDDDKLENVLMDFIGAGGEIIVCTLCAYDREIYFPTYGTIGSGESIHELFIDADKVIDF